jgi:Domain of unknown function (DUF6265)
MHPTRPIEAGIDSLAWLAGRWLGTDGEDRLEETWNEPYGGMMLGMFRWHRGGTARFYELLSIEPGEAGPVFRIKHFDPGLRGWEEKDDAVTLDLVAIAPEEAVFLKRGEKRWMVYRLEAGGNELVCWFETEEKPHAAGNEFRYRRG